MFDLIKMLLMNPVILICLAIGILYTLAVESGLISKEFREDHITINRPVDGR